MYQGSSPPPDFRCEEVKRDGRTALAGMQAGQDPGPGRQSLQFEKHRRRGAAEPDRGHRRGVRFGEVLSGAGGPVRRGLP